MNTEPYKLPEGPVDKLIVKLIRWQTKPLVGSFAKLLLKWRGTDFPAETLMGGDPVIQHGASAVAIHLRAQIGSRVVVMQGVTIGRSDPWRARKSDDIGVIVEDDVFLGAGAAVLFKDGGPPLVVGQGTVVGANAVLTQSTGPWEVWAGNPARKVGERTP